MFSEQQNSDMKREMIYGLIKKKTNLRKMYFITERMMVKYSSGLYQPCFLWVLLRKVSSSLCNKIFSDVIDDEMILLYYI